MSSLSGNELNKKKIIPLINKYKDIRKELKVKIKDKNLTVQERFKYQTQLDNLPKRSSKVKYNTRCAFSYRTRSVDRMTGLNYYHLLQEVSRGKLPGWMLISW